MHPSVGNLTRAVTGCRTSPPAVTGKEVSNVCLKTTRVSTAIGYCLKNKVGRDSPAQKLLKRRIICRQILRRRDAALGCRLLERAAQCINREAPGTGEEKNNPAGKIKVRQFTLRKRSAAAHHKENHNKSEDERQDGQPSPKPNQNQNRADHFGKDGAEESRQHTNAKRVQKGSRQRGEIGNLGNAVRE